MAHLTRRGARAVTTDLDKVASLVQNKFAALGLPERIALDFAKKCDLISDHIERYAIHLAAESGEEVVEEKEEVVEDDKADKKASVKQSADGSVEPGPSNQGFNANDIGTQKAGPLETLPPQEGFMSGHFTQKNFSQLDEKQESGQIGFKVSAALASIEQALAGVRALVASAKLAEDEKPADEKPADEKPADEAEGTDKSASDDFGYNLFN